MKLLIDRDLIELVEIKGKVELDSDVPAELAKVRVVHPDFVKVGTRREADDDLFIANRHDLTYIGNVLNGGIHGNNFGAWSGWRSVLVGDGNRGLYRLKGVSLNPRKPEIIDVSETEFDVFGGQSIDCAEYEKHMSDKFNKTLAKEGITPIMTCKGYWHFPKKIRGDKYSASVIKVEGDTRLDEFMFLVENFLYYRINRKNEVNERGYKLFKNVADLYFDVGYITGRLKKLMDRNLQTWSADQGRSNAHVGNIVLYNGTDKIKVGFVDFDASCDIDDFSKSKLQEIQKIEHETIKNSIMTFPISLRPIQAKYLTQREEARIFPRLRQELVKGFEQGYDSKTIFSRVENELDFGRFLEIVEILRSDLSLVPKPVRRALSGSLEGLINDLGRYDKGYKSYGETEEDCYGLSNYLYNGKNNNLLDKCDILGKNRQYQNKILGKNLYRI